MLRIVGNKWKKIGGLSFQHNTIDIVGCRDIHPFHPPPYFPKATTVFMRDCDKNFVYYWLDQDYFKNVTHFYLASHPCDFMVGQRFNKGPTKLYIEDGYYYHYINRWWSNEETPYIRHISYEKIMERLKVEEKLETFEFYK